MSINRELLYDKLERFIERDFRNYLYEENEKKIRDKCHKGDWIFDMEKIESHISFIFLIFFQVFLRIFPENQISVL